MYTTDGVIFAQLVTRTSVSNIFAVINTLYFNTFSMHIFNNDFRKKQNASEFLLGGRKMGILPVSLSLMATLLSAVMVLGVPAEVYYNGTIYWIILFSNIIVYPLAAHAFLPVYHNLGLTSCYQVKFLFSCVDICHSNICSSLI